MAFVVTVPYMATATAKRGAGKGTKAKTATPKPAPAKKKTRAKKGQGKKPAVQIAFLETVKTENPDISSEEFAIKFNLPPDEVARHKAFVLQYVKDYNVKQAALRMGYPEATAWQTGNMMLHYAFAQLFLAEFQRVATSEAIVTDAQLESRLWEEANRGDIVVSGCAMSNSSTRIAATKLIMQKRGLLAPKPKEPEGGGNVLRVMHVPLVAIAEWGANAQASQKALKASTVIDV